MPPRNPQPPAAKTIEVVDPRWLLKAFAIALAAALLCAYLAVCLLFWQGQWQFAMHPSRTVASTPAAIHLPFEAVHFAPGPSGAPELSGWWIPSDMDPATSRTALLLHAADGTMADALPQAAILHDAHLNVFLFDYRGFGASAGKHPTQQSMQDDTHAAWGFIHSIRNVSPGSLVVFGEGLGAPLALQLCASFHSECPAIILDAPDGDLLERVRHDPRSTLVPVSLLFHETFPLTAPLQSSRSPRLVVTYGSGPAADYIRNAAGPKITVELPQRNDAELDRSIKRFLDEYASRN